MFFCLGMLVVRVLFCSEMLAVRVQLQSGMLAVGQCGAVRECSSGVDAILLGMSFGEIDQAKNLLTEVFSL